MSKIEEPMSSGQITFGKSQILLRNYDNPEEVRMVILEFCEEVARCARKAKKAGRTISLGIGYSKTETGGGFYRSVSLDQPTNVTMEIFKACLKLFRRFYRDQTVRSISVSLSNIIEDNQLQLNLFEQDSAKKRELGYVMDSIKQKYESGAILRAVSFTEAGTAVQRDKLGGHQA